MSIEAAFATLMRRIESLEAQLVAQDRRINNMFREGSIAEVDYEKGLASMDAGGLPTDMSPWLERAGAIRDWTPVTKGERAIFISPSGDPGQGLILPGGYSSQFTQNHNKGGEPTRTVGDTQIQQTGSEIRITAGGSSLVLSPSSVTLITPDYRVNP
ncbi:phage baseplate assembly protein V [Aurantimonas sp. DM33-3]|uniref:phage baseplate assembly protein V n=1 Tax=Aurantimonas sp. DM33-3 TaxID=2766955 RepID=UPI001652082D|nr:phage baseplate assembly protein V [Aurantimonas sp. DM33-3]MBC6714790.1 phage baseplate assembly protein V [Aurantimonas sp. DM33-3]